MNKNTIICTGFHRSGTSLAAQMLHLSGIPVAIELLQGNIANPDGYFEDLVAIRMHDRLLELSNTNWMNKESTNILQNSDFIRNQLNDYITKRTRMSSELWAVKDPRASLFLPAWNEALNNNGYFVIMFRHWTYCLQSMYKRHSRWIAHKLLEENNLEKHMIFWKEPELAARMWLSYNKAILKFIKSNKHNTLLVPQESLLQGTDLISSINNKFSMNLKTIKSPVRSDYCLKSIEDITFKHLPTNLIDELDHTFVQLSESCDFPNTQFNLNLINLEIHKNNIIELKSNLDKLPFENIKREHNYKPKSKYLTSVENTISPEKVNQWLKKNYNQYNNMPLSDLFLINLLNHWSGISTLMDNSKNFLNQIIKNKHL